MQLRNWVAAPCILMTQLLPCTTQSWDSMERMGKLELRDCVYINTCTQLFEDTHTSWRHACTYHRRLNNEWCRLKSVTSVKCSLGGVTAWLGTEHRSNSKQRADCFNFLLLNILPWTKETSLELPPSGQLVTEQTWKRDLKLTCMLPKSTFS